MGNNVKRHRTAQRMSQRELAGLSATSQQQIQRIESNKQAANIELAMRISEALGKNLNSVFPGASRGLISVAREIDAHLVPREGWDELRKSGIEGDPTSHTIAVTLNGHQHPISFQITAGEVRRLFQAIQEEGGDMGVPCVAFDSNARLVAVNFQDLAVCSFTWDIEPPTSEQTELESLRVHLAGSTQPILLEVESDDGSPDDPDDPGQLRTLISIIQNNPEPNERFWIDQGAGEGAFLRAGNIALLEVPLYLIDPDYPVQGDEDDELS